MWKTASARVYLILLGVVFLASCSMAGLQTGEKFLSARDDFNQRLRWQDYQGAARHLAVEQRTLFLEKYSGGEDLRFVAVEPASADLSEENRRAETVTVLQYYRLPSAVVKTFQLKQEWLFENNSWKVVSPFPELP
ncbi:MAG: hypothetical protein R2940_13850 [Syntrophotaleaceae bacterium]